MNTLIFIYTLYLRNRKLHNAYEFSINNNEIEYCSILQKV